jgi:protein TonB
VPAKDARADATAPLDFGLALTGGSGPGAGAVGAHGTAEPEVASKTVRRELTARPGLREGVEPQPCEPPLVKARALELPAPAYSEEARAASIEGKVRVELTVDSTGRVASARVLQGLGHGLDEAALAAAKEGRFEPARRCGEAVESTFVISIRFTL